MLHHKCSQSLFPVGFDRTICLLSSSRREFQHVDQCRAGNWVASRSAVSLDCARSLRKWAFRWLSSVSASSLLGQFVHLLAPCFLFFR